MPFALPPLVVLTLGALGAAAVVRLVVREAQRVNADLERRREAGAPARDQLPTLKRDAVSGEYRPG
jgi:hypothetical protein